MKERRALRYRLTSPVMPRSALRVHFSRMQSISSLPTAIVQLNRCQAVPAAWDH
jgi:hypothetical protein